MSPVIPPRLRAVYPDFDPTIYNYLIKSIKHNVKKLQSIVRSGSSAKTDLKKLINAKILAEDASILQFAGPKEVVVPARRWDDTIEKEIARTAEEFLRLLYLCMRPFRFVRQGTRPLNF